MLNTKRGFTLIELLTVVAILGILIIISMMSWRRSIDKARDGQRKDHLQRIAIAFEDYFNDHNCYPPAEILQTCGGDELRPYLQTIPCDPVTREPYFYVPDSDHPDCPKNFRMLTQLDNDADPAAADLGYGSGLNYGVSSTNVSLAQPITASPSPNPSASSSPAPAASSSPGNLACGPGGICRIYDNPQAAGCPLTFSDPIACQQTCDTSSSYWCNQ